MGIRSIILTEYLEEIKSFKSIDFKTHSDDIGSVEAVFSVFGVRDSDGDVVKAGAIPNESKVTMAWAHDWSKPVGKGTVTVDDNKAIFKGRFFTDTDSGNEAYKIVKNMGADQEWSWGFIAKETMDADPKNYDGLKTREITKAEIFEVSPVLRGANAHTETLAIKSRQQSFADQCDSTLDVVNSMVERAKSLADLRAKDNRTIGSNTSEQLADLADALEKCATEILNVIKVKDEDEYGHIKKQVQQETAKFYNQQVLNIKENA